MATVAAALANGGKLVRPRLLIGTRAPGAADFTRAPPEPPRDLGWPSAHLAPVREGMRRAVMAENGTARRARAAGVEMAGKTGTAEFGPPTARRHRGWFISFAPYDRPRYALAIVVDEAISGGLTAAPLAREVWEALFAAPGGEAGG